MWREGNWKFPWLIILGYILYFYRLIELITNIAKILKRRKWKMNFVSSTVNWFKYVFTNKKNRAELRWEWLKKMRPSLYHFYYARFVRLPSSATFLFFQEKKLTKSVQENIGKLHQSVANSLDMINKLHYWWHNLWTFFIYINILGCRLDEEIAGPINTWKCNIIS